MYLVEREFLKEGFNSSPRVSDSAALKRGSIALKVQDICGDVGDLTISFPVWRDQDEI